MNRYVYDEKLELEQEVNKLDKKIEDLKYANIVSSKMQESINEDIKNINIKIRDININNIECALIRKVKVLGKYVLRAIPYVIIANLFLGFHLFIFREFPFYRDLEKRFPLHEVTLDKDVTIDKVEETRKPRYNNEVYYTDGKAFYTTKWELGETTPEMDKLLKMSEIFEITLDELMKEEDTNIESENINNISNSKAKFIKYLGVFLIIVLTIIIIKTIIVLVSAKVFEFNPNSQFIEETEVIEEQMKEDSNF